MAIRWNDPRTAAGLPNGGVATQERPALQPAFDDALRHPILARYGALLGRVLLAHIFVLSGIMKILTFNDMNAFMAGAFDRLAGFYDIDAGWIDALKSAIPVLMALASATEILGGLALLVGWQGRAAATLLFLFLIPTTLIFHSFWTYPAEQQQEQLINFQKNLAIMGGLWMVISLGPGGCSVDWATEKRK